MQTATTFTDATWNNTTVWSLAGGSYPRLLWEFAGATPTVTSLSPTAGSTAGGTVVTITGTNLSGATAVTFDATAGTGIIVDSATQVRATSPAHAAGTVHVTVTTPGGTTATGDGDQFTYANTAPSLTLDGGSQSYTENGTAVQVSSGATASDPEGNWNGGTLSVQISANAQATDTLAIGGATGLTVSGVNLQDGATTFATLSTSGGAVTNTTTLTITFNASATSARVQKTVQAMTFVSSSENPSTSTRTVSFTLADAAAASASGSRGVTVTAVNDAPVFTASGPFSVSEAAVNGDAVGNVDANDGEGGATDAGLTYSITGGTGQTLFSINSASGAITVNATGAAALNYEAATSYTLTVRANDGGGSNNTTDASVTINIGNAAPVITAAQSFTIVENSANTTVVGTVAVTGDIDGLTWSITSGNTGGAFAVNAATGQITVATSAALDFESVPSFTLGFRATDGTTPSDQSVAITVTNAEEPPIITSNAGGATAAINVAEGQTTVTTVTATDSDAGNTVTFGKSGADAAFFTLDGASGELVFATARDFETKADADNDNTYEVTITATDSSGSALTDTQAISVTITNVNEPPTLDAAKSPVLAGINEDPGAPADGSTAGSTLVSALIDIGGALSNVTDPDAGALAGIAVTGVSAQGKLFYTINGGTTWTELTGTVSDTSALLLNADANTRVYFQPNANINGAIANAITLTAWDRTAGTNGATAQNTTTGTAFSAATDTAGITVTAVNDAPTLDAISDPAAISEDAGQQTVNLAGIGAGAGETQALGVAASSSNTALIPHPAVTYTSANATGSLAYTPVANANGSAVITVTVTDDGGVLNGGVATFSRTFTVNVTAVNDAPVLTPSTPALTGLTENETSNVGQTVASFASATITDGDAGAAKGIAITSFAAGNGAWQYWTDENATWSSIGAVAVNSALLLRAVDLVRFVPNGLNGTTGSLTYRAWDQTSGTFGTKADATNGGTTRAFSTASDTASITVASVNDAPAGANKTITVTEDIAYTLTAADFGFSDAAEGNAFLAVKITTLPTAGTLTNNGGAIGAGSFVTKTDIDSNLLVFTPASNANGATYATMTFQVQDDGGTANSGVDLDPSANTLTFAVTAVNDAPTLTTISTLAGAEDTPLTISYATLATAANEADVDSATLSFRVEAVSTGTLTKGGSAVVAGTTLLGSGESLVWTPATDASSTLNAFTVTAWDGTLASATPVQVQVEAAPTAETPTVTGATTMEDTQTTTGLVITADVADGVTVTHFKITAITGGSLYKTDGTTAIANNAFITRVEGGAGLKFTPTANANNTAGGPFTFAVQAATDGAGAGLSPAATATISVTAVNDAPVVTTSGGTTAYTEGNNTSASIAIDTGLTVTDVDNTTLATATIAITGGYQLTEDALGLVPNAGTMGNIAVAGWDSTNGILTLASDAASATLAEWQAALRAVTYANTSETPDTGNRTIRFLVNDGTADSAASTKTLSVTATNDTPVVTTSGGTTAFTEANNAASTPVVVDSTLTVTDDSTTFASATISITGSFAAGEDVLAFTNPNPGGEPMGNIAGAYTAGTGVLTLTSAGASATTAQWIATLRAVVYTNSSNTPNTTTRTISFAVNDGATTSTAATKAVSVAATNDTPTNIALTNATVPQSAGANGVVGTFSTTDLDDVVFTYTLVIGDSINDAGNGLFNISGISLRATDAGAIPGGTYQVRIQTDDGHAAGTFVKSFAVTVTDDVAPAAPSTPNLDDASDTGASATDNITTDTTPTFTGTAEANSTVEVFRGGTTSLGTTTADGTGAWTFTPGTALAAGAYSITAKAKDAADHTGAASTALSLTIDATAPAVSTIARHDPVTFNTDDTPVTWRVTFAEAVTEVDDGDFVVTLLDGAAAGAVALVTQQSALIYDVEVNVSGQGALRLDLNASGTGIADLAGNQIAGGFAVGDAYIVGVANVFDTLSLLNDGVVNVTAAGPDKVAQRFTTAAAEPLTLTTVTAVIGPTITGTPAPVVTIHADAGGAPAASVLATLDNPAVVEADALNVWTGSAVLEPSTTYWIVFTTTAGSFEIAETAAITGGEGAWLASPAAADYVYRHGINAASGPTAGALQIAMGATSTPVITSVLTGSGTYGTAFAGYTITATNTPTSFAATGLPTGLSLNAATGVISGTPTQAGTFNTISLTATNASGTGPASTLTLTIAKAPLTVTANDTSRYVGYANPTFTVSYSGFRNGDTAAALTTAPTATTTATNASPVGTYPITPAGGVSANYTFSYVAGTLTVTTEPPQTAQTITFAPLGNAVVGDVVSLSASASSGLPVTFSLISGPATLSGGAVTCTGIGVVTVRAAQAGNGTFLAATPVEQSFTVGLPTPTVTTPTQVPAPAVGEDAVLTVPQASAGLTYQWQRNGEDLANATNPTLTLPDMQPPAAGLYTYTATTAAGTGGTSEPVIVGVATEDKVTGTGELVGADIHHPNGNVYDQLILEGDGATFTAEPAQVTRMSYVDLSGDIVQVEFSGAGSLSLVMDDAGTPAPAANYNQPGVNYVRGNPGIVITGADETTNVSVISVGRINAVNQSLFRDDVTYDGVANIAFIAIQSTNGQFGGVRTGNVEYFAAQGFTGVYAPGVKFNGPVNIGDIQAHDDAQPLLVVGSAANVRIAGGNLAQPNGQPIRVDGLTQVTMAPGQTSQGGALPAQTNQGILQQDGIDVTDLIVAGQ